MSSATQPYVDYNIYLGFYPTAFGGGASSYKGLVQTLSYTKALHPRDWSATVTIATTLSLLPAWQREIFIERVDAQGNKALQWRGVVTNIKRDLTTAGITSTLQCQGLWWQLTKRLATIPVLPSAYTTQDYSQPGSVTANFISTQPMPPPGYYSQQAGAPVNTGQTGNLNLPSGGQIVNKFIYQLNMIPGGLTVSDLLYLQIRADAGQTPTVEYLNPGENIDPNNLNPADNIVYGVDSQGGAVPVGSVFAVGTSTINIGQSLVQDPTYVFYQTMDSVLDGLSSGSTYTGELRINIHETTQFTDVFSQTGVTGYTVGIPLDLKSFNPPVSYGIGTNRSNQIFLIEGNNIVELHYTSDYESMVTELVLGGLQFGGTPIASAIVDPPTPLNQALWGNQQQFTNIGNVISPAQIFAYATNLFTLTSNPVPQFSVTIASWYLNNVSIAPGDIISVISPTYGPIVNNYVNPVPGANTFTARVSALDVSWDLNGAETVVATLVTPVTGAFQSSVSFASPTLRSSVGGLKRYGELAYRNINTTISEIKISINPFVLQDSTSTDGNILGAQNVLNLYLPAFISNGTSVVQQFILTMTSLTPGTTSMKVTIVAPNGNTVFADFIQVNTGITYDFTSLLNSANQIGTFLFLFENKSHPTINSYTGTMTLNILSLYSNTVRIVGGTLATGTVHG